MSVFEDMAYLLPQGLRAICLSSVRRLSAPFTPMFPARHLPTLFCCRVWCRGSSAAGRCTTHITQVSERCTPAKPVQAYLIFSTCWKANFVSVDKGGYSLFTAARSYRRISTIYLFKYYHKHLIDSLLSHLPTHCTYQVAGFRRPLRQHSTFPSCSFS